MGHQQDRNPFRFAVLGVVVLLLVTTSIDLANAKRTLGGSRKTSSSTRRQPSSSSGHVTQPTYMNSGSNSHSDLAKLSYSNYNSQPNRGAGTGSNVQNPAPIGWNVPKAQGPPPAYSASNPAGGAKTNFNEAPPAYRPNNAAPPSYGAAMGTGNNMHTPITATNVRPVQSSYPVQQGMSAGATYHSPQALPAGATYYPSGHLPAGASHYPSGGSYPVGGGYPAGGHLPGGYMGGGGYPHGGGYGGVPAGATYVPAGGALPPGAVFYSQPPQQSSSGLGFGSGLAAGAIGGAILGHVLTPTQTRVVDSSQPSSSGSDDKVIIINNGPPGSVTTTGGASGATIINTGASGSVAPAVAPPVAGPAPVAAPPGAATQTGDMAVHQAGLAPIMADNGTAPTTDGQAPAVQPPPAGGIICVPVRVNDTDPNDSTKMIEVEKVACYPAPPPPPAETNASGNGIAAPIANDQTPMAPMNSAQPSQLNQPTQRTLLPDQSAVQRSGTCVSQAYTGFALLIALLGVFMG